MRHPADVPLFPEEDDDRNAREAYDDWNLKANEFLFRRVDVEDVVCAHLLAAAHAAPIGFRRYIISSTTPFLHEDLPDLHNDPLCALRRRVPAFEAEYARRGWKSPAGIDRVYVNERARRELGWRPKHDFASLIARLAKGEDIRSELALRIGSKGYHGDAFADGPYPVE